MFTLAFLYEMSQQPLLAEEQYKALQQIDPLRKRYYIDAQQKLEQERILAGKSPVLSGRGWYRLHHPWMLLSCHTIDLSHNHLTQTTFLKGLPNLRNIILDHNQISKLCLAGTFVTHCTASHNVIVDIELNSSIVLVELEGNPLSERSIQLLASCQTLK